MSFKLYLENINNDFINALNNYINDNYSDDDLKVLNKHKAIKKIDIDEHGAQGILYRGIFFNDLSEEQKSIILSEAFYHDDGMSYTYDINEALAFASGSNIFEFDKNNISLDDNQLGLVVRTSASSNDIIIDFNFVLKNNTYTNLDIIEENEVLLHKKNRVTKIIYVINHNGIVKK